MKYLTLTVDYTDSCIHDDAGSEIKLDDLGLPKDFIDELTVWHAAYLEIIPLNDGQRLSKMDKIEELDQTGLYLARRLMDLVPGGAKVKYFSEGKLKYLWF